MSAEQELPADASDNSETVDSENKETGEVDEIEENHSPTAEHPSEKNRVDQPEKDEKNQDKQPEDDGWDETETLAARFQKLGEDERNRQQKGQSMIPRPESETDKLQESGEKAQSNVNDGDAQGEEQPRRPSIWKELEKMQTQSRGGRFGRETAPRFQKAAEKYPTDNRRDEFEPGGDRGNGRRFHRDDGRHRSGNFAEFEHGSRYHEQGFSSSNESRISKESHAYRFLKGTLQDSGRGVKQDFRGNRRPFEREDATTGSRSSRKLHADDQSGARPSDSASWRQRDRQHRNYAEHSDCDKPENSQKMWPARSSDLDAANSHRSTSSRGSPIFESVKRALENFDSSNWSSRQLTAFFLKTADEHCENDSDRWVALIDEYAMTFAISHGGAYVEFVASLFGRLINRPLFQKAAYISLMRYITYVMSPHDWTERDFREAKTMCDLFGHLLVYKWSPGWDSCAKECNMIVYAVMNAFKTWLNALEQVASGEMPIRDDVAEVSAFCIWHVTVVTGRKLWLKWPDLVDQLYSVLRPAIVSNSDCLTEETKLQLLDLYMKVNEWPKPASQSQKQVFKYDAAVQTDPQMEAPKAVAPVSTWVGDAAPSQAVAPMYIGRQMRPIGLGNQSLFSVPPQTVPFQPPPPQLQNLYAASIQYPQQQHQSGAYASSPRLSYIGPMKK